MKFANTLAARLRSSEVVPVSSVIRPGVVLRYYYITGRLDIGVEIVRLEIGVPWLFRDLKRFPPIAACGEPWMKSGADWHNGRIMCWVLHNEWRDAMSWKGKSVRAIMTEGRDLFFNNVRNLLNRHYTADVEGLTAWDPDWEYWGHDYEGVQQYEHERRHAKIRLNGRRRSARRIAIPVRSVGLAQVDARRRAGADSIR